MYLRGFDSARFPFSGKRRANHKNQAVIYIKRGVMTMQRKKSFVVVLAVIVFALGARGQEVRNHPVLPAPLELRRTMDLSKTARANAMATTGLMQPFGSLRLATITMDGKPIGAGFNLSLPEDYYTQHFGIMCRKEWQFEKTTHIPLRLRLGSLEECNTLEGKK
jgi:hypothetical protein